MTMGKIRNPYAVKTSNEVDIVVAVDAAFTAQIAATSGLRLDASELAASPISGLQVTVPQAQRTVQEDVAEMQLTFTTSSVIPAGSGFEQGVHVYFPRAFLTPSVSGISSRAAEVGFASGGSINIVNDTSNDFEENCQVWQYVCYRVEVPANTISDDVQPQEWTITIKYGVANPISVEMN